MKDALEGHFRITNVPWNNNLTDSNSEEFKTLSSELQVGLLDTLRPMGAEADFFLGNFKFASGSVKVTYRYTMMTNID